MATRRAVAIGETAAPPPGGDDPKDSGDIGGGATDEDALQARLDALRRG
jgi:charged multivesicular body protein 2A